MLRTNGRALKLNPETIGYFTWWSILDQRVSPWTTLVGPIAVAWAALSDSAAIIALYIGWVMLTRYLFCAVIAGFRGEWFPVSHPFILYFGQISGAAVKTFVLFRLDRQKWTRQGAGGAGAMSRAARLLAFDSTLHHVIALTVLTLAVILVTMI
jgi:glycosyltransferase Alg8